MAVITSEDFASIAKRYARTERRHLTGWRSLRIGFTHLLASSVGVDRTSEAPQWRGIQPTRTSVAKSVLVYIAPQCAMPQVRSERPAARGVSCYSGSLIGVVLFCQKRIALSLTETSVSLISAFSMSGARFGLDSFLRAQISSGRHNSGRLNCFTQRYGGGGEYAHRGHCVND